MPLAELLEKTEAAFVCKDLNFSESDLPIYRQDINTEFDYSKVTSFCAAPTWDLTLRCRELYTLSSVSNFGVRHRPLSRCFPLRNLHAPFFSFLLKENHNSRQDWEQHWNFYLQAPLQPKFSSTLYFFDKDSCEVKIQFSALNLAELCGAFQPWNEQIKRSKAVWLRKDWNSPICFGKVHTAVEREKREWGLSEWQKYKLDVHSSSS